MLHPFIRSSLLSATLAVSATVAGGCGIDDATRGLFASEGDGAASSTHAASGGAGGASASTASAGGAGGEPTATAGAGGEGGGGAPASSSSSSASSGSSSASSAGGAGGAGGEAAATAGAGGGGGDAASSATSTTSGSGGEGGEGATTSSSTGAPAPTLDCGDVTCPQGDGRACCFAGMDRDRPSACVSGPPGTTTCDEVGEGAIVTRIECQLPSHCGSGETCCGSTRRGYYLEVSCQRDCEPDDVRLCDPENPVCPRVDGEQTVCRRSERLPDNYFVCTEP